MKGYALLGDAGLYRAYRADVTGVYRAQYLAGHFLPVVPHTGQFVLERPFSGLQMFWPLLPLLEGNLVTALETYAANLEIVSLTLFQPEGYFVAPGKILYADASYPLRPEFIEATYSLYRATHDNVFLRVCSLSSSTLSATPVFSLFLLFVCGCANEIGISSLIDRDAPSRTPKRILPSALWCSRNRIPHKHELDRQNGLFLSQVCTITLMALLNAEGVFHTAVKTS